MAMRNKRVIFIAVICLILAGIGITFFQFKDSISTLSQKHLPDVVKQLIYGEEEQVYPEEGNARRTAIMVDDGAGGQEVLNSIEADNVTMDGVGGMKILPDTLNPEVTVVNDADDPNPSLDVKLRNNNGTMEFQHAGGDWKVVGSGSGGDGGTSITTIEYTWHVNGSVLTGTVVDLARSVDIAGTLLSCEVLLEDTGTGGSNLEVDVLNNGTTIFETKPTITANSGTYQTASTDINQLTGVADAEEGDLYTLSVVSAPDGANDLVVTLTQAVASSNGTIFTPTWMLVGGLSSGVFDISRNNPQIGVIQTYICVLRNTGTGGDDFVADLLVNGTSIYASGGTKPTITANSGTSQVDESTDIPYILGYTDSYFEAEIETFPTGSEDVQCSATILYPQKQYLVYVWKVSGALVVDQAVDLERYVFTPGAILSVSAVLGDTGTGGDDLSLDVNADGTSVYAGGGTKPTIPANSGTLQRDISSDMATKIVAKGSLLSIDVDTTPTNGGDLTVQLIQQIIN
jgi:hypothetical protein